MSTPVSLTGGGRRKAPAVRLCMLPEVNPQWTLLTRERLVYKDTITGSLVLVLCNYLTLLTYGGQRTGSGGLQTRLGPGSEGPGRERPKAGRLLHHAVTLQKTCPLIEGRGGAHADSPRWQEKGNSSSLCARVSDPFPAGGPGGGRSAADSVQ